MMTVSELCRFLTERHGRPVSPRAVTTLFYTRTLPDGLAPIVGGRRLIPRDAVPTIELALKRRGILSSVRFDVPTAAA